MFELVSPASMMSMIGLTFSEYRENFSTYRKLLQTRYDEVRLLPDIQVYLNNYPDQLQWVIVVDEENPETTAILPIVRRITDCSLRFNFYVVPAERDFTPLEQLLGDDDFDDELSEMEFPLLLLFDEEWHLQAYWGPRPEAADAYLEVWLEDHPTYEELATDDSPESHTAYLKLLTELTQSMRTWYNSGLEEICIQEIYALLETVQEQATIETGSENGNSSEQDVVSE